MSLIIPITLSILSFGKSDLETLNFAFVFVGNPCPYVIEDQNEDTISALVRLITEKKGIFIIVILFLFTVKDSLYMYCWVKL